MKKLAYIIAIMAIVFTASNAAFAAKPVQNHPKSKHITTYHEGDPLGRNHWTYGRRARMRKQMIQAQYHEQQVERAEALQRKVAAEQRRAHLSED